MQSTIDTIIASIDGGVLSITLNRPEQRNAIASDMVPELTRLMREARDEMSVRSVLIQGAGEHFTAGGDVAGFRRTLAMAAGERQREFHGRLDRAAAMVEAFLTFDRPIVAICRGGVAGAGLMFALAADLVFADETVNFVFAHRRMALVPDGGVSYLLPRVVGLRQAKRLLLTAAQVGAEEALRLGLVTSVHAAADLDEAAREAAKAFARAPQLAMRSAKVLLNDSLDRTASDQLAAERDGIVACVGDPDFDEAVNAFLDKRPARFPSAS